MLLDERIGGRCVNNADGGCVLVEIAVVSESYIIQIIFQIVLIFLPLQQIPFFEWLFQALFPLKAVV